MIRDKRYLMVENIISGIDAIRPEKFFFAGEAHDFWELVYVHSGNATATADERIYNLDKGKLLIHKPMEFHRIWTDDKPAHLKIIAFVASGEGMEGFKNSCFDLDVDECETFLKITDDVISAISLAKKKDPSYLFVWSLALTEIELFLLRLTAKEKYRQKNFSQSERQYYRIVNVMKDNCERNLSVDELAVLCNMSVSNMKRVFALYSDIGVAKYFLNLKIGRARELIIKGEAPSDIALKLGFNEISYFYTVFKRETGMTPAEFYRSKI